MDSTTLQYGTADAAKTVHNMDPDLELKLKAAAKKLNLRTHLVGGKVSRWCVCVECQYYSAACLLILIVLN